MSNERLVFVSALFGFVLFILIISYSYDPIARDFPQLVAGVTLILLGWDLALGLWKRKKGFIVKKEQERRLPRSVLVRRWLAVGLSLAVYVIFLPKVGFLVMTALLILSLLWFFDQRRPLTLVLYTSLTVGTLYVVFVRLMFVPLPHGTWW